MNEQAIVDAVENAVTALSPYTPIELSDFLSRSLPKRKMLLDPIIRQAGLTMMYAPRGIGKTFLALSMAYAIASGKSCLRWNAPEPGKVIYLDGEMPQDMLQSRMQLLAKSYGMPPEGNLKLLSADMLLDGMPDLSMPYGWENIWQDVQGADLIILDNLSTLCRGGRENEAESWVAMQDALLRLRRAGIAVLMVHHAGKGGGQRGTSKREDILDTVIALRRPADYSTKQGARFELHYEKARGFHGAEAEPLEATLSIVEGQITWEFADAKQDGKAAEAAKLFEQGQSVRQVADAIGVSTATAGRYRQDWNAGKQQG